MPLPATHVPVSDRVHLTELRPADLGACLELLNDPDVYERTLRIPSPYIRTDFEFFLNLAQEAVATFGRNVHFAIRDREEKLLGVCSFDELIPGHKAEIGYWLGKPYWGQGIMTSVVSKLVEMGQREWQLVRITAHVFDFNVASARVLEKAGFQFEGAMPNHYRKAGKFIAARAYAWVKERDL